MPLLTELVSVGWSDSTKMLRLRRCRTRRIDLFPQPPSPLPSPHQSVFSLTTLTRPAATLSHPMGEGTRGNSRCPSSGRSTPLLPSPPHDISKNRRTILLLLGEKAGMRAGVTTISFQRKGAKTRRRNQKSVLKGRWNHPAFPPSLRDAKHFARLHQPLRGWLISTRRSVTQPLCGFAALRLCVKIPAHGRRHTQAPHGPAGIGGADCAALRT